MSYTPVMAILRFFSEARAALSLLYNNDATAAGAVDPWLDRLEIDPQSHELRRNWSQEDKVWLLEIPLPHGDGRVLVVWEEEGEDVRVHYVGKI